MIGIFRDLVVDRFWTDWDQKFRRNTERYITPDDPVVSREADSLDINQSLPESKIADKLWEYILDEYDYKLSKEWKRPRDTIIEGVGDCEDYCFLIGSLLPNYGVDEFTIVAGKASYREASEFHVWMEIGGRVIDPTAEEWKADVIEYNPELSYDIKVGET